MTNGTTATSSSAVGEQSSSSSSAVAVAAASSSTMVDTLPPSPYQRQHDDVNGSVQPPGGGGDPEASTPDLDEDNGGGGYVDSSLSLEEVMYGASSYHAIAKPVTLTMILASLAVVFIQTEQSRAQAEAEMSSYTVFNPSESSSTSEAIEYSLLNALVIVTVICTMTFGIVFLYKFRCMKFLIGYMMLSSSMLLGFLGGILFYTAIQKYSIPISTPTFYLFLFNFAVVGTTSIFYQRGIPMYITQGYLVATSVILAWQLSHFDPWTAWALLIMLALYDLCAVLTPCGPLKALVNAMQEDDSPDMPGLLYEAQLPEGTRRPGQGGGGGGETRSRSSSRGNDTGSRNGGPPPRGESGGSGGGGATNTENPMEMTTRQGSVEMSVAAAGSTTSSIAAGGGAPATTAPPSSSSAAVQQASSDAAATQNNTTAVVSAAAASTSTSMNVTAVTHTRGRVPLAIARLYRLPLVSPPPPTTSGGGGGANNSGRSSASSSVDSDVGSSPDASPLLDSTSTTANNTATNGGTVVAGSGVTSTANGTGGGVTNANTLATQPTAAELREEVDVIFPRNGGKIERRLDANLNPRYVVLGRDGDIRRILLVDRRGRVFQETDDDDDSEYDDDDEKDASIRLGLGDFIFYSVLVSKAAMYSFTTFIACMLVILAGLGGTLVLLAVYHKALPALPISIFLGVVFYVLTRLVIEPWIQGILMVPYYI